jgi:hypothetical protein
MARSAAAPRGLAVLLLLLAVAGAQARGHWLNDLRFGSIFGYPSGVQKAG